MRVEAKFTLLLAPKSRVLFLKSSKILQGLAHPDNGIFSVKNKKRNAAHPQLSGVFNVCPDFIGKCLASNIFLISSLFKPIEIPNCTSSAGSAIFFPSVK
jgi:hypothetical protein